MNITILFERLATGDVKAFESIFERYHDRVYEIVFAYTRDTELAKDAVQELFLKIWERRAELNQIQHPEGWFFRAVKYQAWYLLRKYYSEQNFKEKIRSRLNTAQSTPEDILLEKQRQLTVEKALGILSEKQLMVYRLAREQGLTYEQIATELNIGKETVKEHMGKALKKIRAELLKQKEWWLPVFFCLLNNF